MKSKTETIFGLRATIEAIKSGKEIEKILFKNGLKGTLFYELFALIKKLNLPFQYVPVEKLNRITGKNHQGIVAFISQIEYKNIEEILPALYEQGKLPLLLILDKITDVRNFGAIARTAECAGIHSIIIPDKGSAQINADAIKTSAGALHSIPVCRSNNLKETIKYLKESGVQIIAATERAEELYYNVDFTLPAAIIIGSEEKGVAPEYLKLSDKIVKIPISGNIESLNVSVATAVIVYEAIRQRRI